MASHNAVGQAPDDHNNPNNTTNTPTSGSQQPPPSKPVTVKQNSTLQAAGTNKTGSSGDVIVQVGDAGNSKEAKESNLGASLVVASEEEEAAANNKKASAAAAAEKESNLGASPVANKEKERADNANVAAEKVLSVSANLAKLLPSGAVLVFQTLSASFTNQGSCHTANKWLSGLLVTFLTAACIFLTFTDSIVYKDKVYYGVALPRRLNIFALSQTEEKQLFRELGTELKKRRLKALDWVHAFFTAIVFLSIAMGDVGLQKCFVPDLDDESMTNVKELLRNAPLGLALLSSFVFMIFPTTRHGVGFENSNRVNAAAETAEKKGSSSSRADQGAQQNPPKK